MPSLARAFAFANPSTAKEWGQRMNLGSGESQPNLLQWEKGHVPPDPANPNLTNLSTTMNFQTIYPFGSHPACVPGSKSVNTVNIQLTIIIITGTPRNAPCENAISPVAPQKGNTRGPWRHEPSLTRRKGSLSHSKPVF